MEQDKNPLLVTMLFLVLIIVTRVQELFTFLLPFRIALIGSLVAFLIFLLGSRTGKPVNLMRIPQVKMMLVIYLLCFFSIPFSVYRRQSFEFTAMKFSIILLFFFLLLYSVKNYNDLRKVIWTYIFGVLLLTLFTVMSGIVGGIERPSSSNTYDTNDIAAIIVVTLPIIYFFMMDLNGIKKLFLFCSIVVMIFALILTSSRGGFLGLLAVSILLFFKDSARSWAFRISVAILLIFSFILFAPASYKNRMATITAEEDYNRTLKGGRIELWKEGIGLILKSPITGMGAGAIDTALGTSSGVWKTTHNSFIQIGVELGVGGFILLIALLRSSISRVRRFRIEHFQQKSQAGKHVWLATALEISLWGYCVVGFFLSWAYSSVFLFLIALCAILNKLELKAIDEKQSMQECYSALH